MEFIREFIRWSWKVLKEWVWVLGFAPQLLDCIFTYIPTEHIPSDIRNLLEKGGNWQLTLALIGIGLFVSAYRVHLQTVRTLKKRESRIRELEDHQPHVVVGFQDGARHLVDRLELQLNPLPQKPDVDALVEEKRRDLLAKRPSSGAVQGLAAVAAAIASAPFTQVNPHYEEEVEQYLVEYRDFVIKEYECTVDRAHAVYPIIENRGNYPANDVTVEFAMPSDYREPAEHHCFDRSTSSAEEMGVYVFPPSEPEPFTSRLDMLDQLAIPGLYSPILPPLELPSSIGGPNHEERDGIHYIAYTLERVVQHQPEDDFEPFWLWLADIDHSTVWRIPLRITSADLRQPQKAVLFLEIRVSEKVGKADDNE